MKDISQFIEMVRSNDTNAPSAVKQLIDMGMSAVPILLDAIRNGPIDGMMLLGDIILQIRDPNIVPVLLGLLNETSSALVVIAFKGLAQCKEQRILEPLLAYVLDTRNTETRRSLAAETLGELGNPKAVEGLLKVVEEAVEDDMPVLVTDAAIALAKLGNHEKAPIVMSLTSDNDDPIIRANAVKALQYIVGPGMFASIQRALHDSYYEVRMAAVEAMFLLGVKTAIDNLILCVEDENLDIANNAIVRLHDLTGETFHRHVRVQDLLEWWDHQQNGYRDTVCYRLGKPLWIPDIIALLEEPYTRRQIVEELRIITGTDLGYNPYIPDVDQNHIFLQAQIWWKSEGHRFEAGQLYKYGYKQNIQDIF